MPSALSVTEQSVSAPDGFLTSAFTWLPPVWVRGRASTVKSVVASRNTAAREQRGTDFERTLKAPSQTTGCDLKTSRPFPASPGPNTLTLEVSTAGSTTTLAGKPGTGWPP